MSFTSPSYGGTVPPPVKDPLHHETPLPPHGGVEKVEKWEKAIKSIPVFKWFNDARNLVVHEADMSLESSARVEYSGPGVSYARDLDVAPQTPSEEILARFLLKHPAMVRSGLLRISREWKANTLPDQELLLAGTELFRGVSRLVEAFHEGSDGDCSDLELPHRDCASDDGPFKMPQCMATCFSSLGTPASITIDIASRQEVVTEIRTMFQFKPENLTEESVKKAALERYGMAYLPEGDLIHIAPPVPCSSPRCCLPWTAKLSHSFNSSATESASTHFR